LLLAACLASGPLASAADERATQTEANQAASEAHYVSPTNGLGSWIWADTTSDRQICHFWQSFEIATSPPVTRARLLMTVDNEYTLYLDGREVGRGAEWRHLYEYDLTLLLSPGRHILAVKAFNSDAQAGLIFGLRIELEGGQVQEIKSDTSWRIVPDGTRGWEKKTEAPNTWPAATVMAPLGGSPLEGLPWWVTPEAIEILPAMQPIRIHFWQTGWFQVTLLSVCGVVILISLRLMTQVALHQKEKLLLQGERERIARDIHDDIGARMTQLVLRGEVAQSDLTGDSKTRQHLNGICEEARGLLSTMDEILWAVNPRRDTLRDFSSYVCNYAQTFLNSTSIQCLFEVDPEMSSSALALPVRRSLLMAIKETLNNAVKYSQATELRLKIHWQGRQLVVVVQDNGRGFDPATTKPGRNGLNNMMLRMRELGGRCQVTSQPGQGCRVEFEIPLTRPHDYTLGRIWRSRSAREQINNLPNPQGHEVRQTQESTKD
jgi:signal transduction histidine kinase